MFGHTSLTGRRVLIVEDEALIAAELNERLSKLGMVVVGSVDAAEQAVERAVASRPDIVLMDVRLRGKRDGIDAAEDIRRVIDVPVVFLTAHSDRATVERSKQAAPFGYILKPFQEREVAIAIDVALHRHMLERQLVESQRRFVATLASIGDGVIATDLGGRVSFMNPVAEALTGWTFADAQGRGADEVFRIARGARDSPPLDHLRQAVETRGAVREEGGDLVLTSRTGEAIAIDDCASPILDEGGVPTGAVVAFRDIRARIRTQQVLHRAQQDLLQSQKLESVGRLAAGIAHDFNNLLTVVNGSCQLALRREGLDQATRDLFQNILNAGARATSITGQFLAFGGKLMLEPRRLDLNQLVRDVGALVRHLLDDRIELAMQVSATPLVVLADPAQIKHALVNLAVNARDAMAEGGTLTMTTCWVEVAHDAETPSKRPGRYAVLAVTDTGPRIEDAVRDRMFEPYYTTRNSATGSGLGLATVFGIVKQSRGFISVDSQPGLGNTIRVHLPLVHTGEPLP